MKKFLILVFSIMLLVSTADYSNAATNNSNVTSLGVEETSSPMMVLDVAFLRPLGLVSTVVGTAIFIVTLPISIPTKSADDVASKMVYAPFNYTFRRPIGMIGSTKSTY